MKKIYKLKGLDCANCATKIESQIKKIRGIESASISFITGRMVIEYSEENIEEIFKQIKKAIKRQEPDMKLEEI
ncbi:MAG: heavy-metal-associated domain-containing protein [Clostridia bacterium]|nr:heavy-metal-associated domain-containing protein [Clostridia bacterium]